MASYTHSCEACGARMSVDERHWGRTLRCRSCRAPFIADPEGAGIGARSTEHTCTACGAVMAVAERYAGRSLRCTSCGEPFVARMPSPPEPATVPPEAPSGPSADAAPVPFEARRPVRRRRMLWVVAVVAASAAIAALLWWLGGARDAGPGSFLFATEKQRTQIGRLDIDGAEAVPVALDREAFDQLAAAARSDDPGALQALRGSPRYRWLPAGTQVRVLERRTRGVEARVRVLDGPESSRIVWVPITWVR